MAAAGALLISSGVALVAAPSPATAGAPTAVQADCTPSNAYTETSDWLTTSPGAGWYQVAQRSVLVTPGSEPVFGPGQRWQWHPKGPQDEGGTMPTFSTTDDHWSPSNAHYNGEDPLGEVFQVGRGNDGDNASWFYWEKIVITPGAEPVYRAEYKFSFDHPAVTCETAPVVSPPTTPQVSPPKAHVKAKAHVKTPTVVHAGLVTTSSDTGVQAGLGLVLAGLVLLAGAGGLVLAGGGEPKDAA